MSLQKKKFDLNDPTSTVVPAVYPHVGTSILFPFPYRRLCFTSE